MEESNNLYDFDGNFQQPSCSYSTAPVAKHEEKESWLKRFLKWNITQQIACVRNMLSILSWYQNGCLNYFSQPTLKRDFISLCSNHGLDHVSQKILTYLDPKSLANAELVSEEWKRVIFQEKIWKRLIEWKIQTNFLWKKWIIRRNLLPYMFTPRPGQIRPSQSFYRWLFLTISQDLETLESNWNQGIYSLNRVDCESTERRRGVYCLQCDNQKIVTGLRDNTVKIWDRRTRQCIKVFSGHTGSVLCLQYNGNILVTGSSDTTVRIWDIESGETIYEITHHSEAVLHLRFNDRILLTSSKDCNVVVWKINFPSSVTFRRVLVGHRGAVNAVDFDEKYIVSGSGDRTIKIWDTPTGDFIRTLSGHMRGIACLEFKGKIIASGSSDCTIRLWDVDRGTCLRVLRGHADLVRSVRLDSKRIVSGCYGGKIKIWDLVAALDLSKSNRSLCVRTLTGHSGRIFRLQFDEFQIVSSGHDDYILIWDFLNSEIDQIPLLDPLEEERLEDEM